MHEAVIGNNRMQVKKKKKQSMSRVVINRILNNRVSMAGLIILLIIVLACVFAKFIAPYDPMFMDYKALKSPPSSTHIMGCDALGRDIFSRILYGGQYSLSIGLICSLIGAVLGVFFGSIVGYESGRTDMIVMRICDIWSAIPAMLLAIVISTTLGAGFFNTILAMTVGGIPGSIRGSRAMALKEREMEYLEAAKAMNCSKFKIIFRHMAPNIVSPTIVGTTGSIGGTIMMVAGLAYIGLGIQPPTPEWGAMCAAGRQYILNYPHMIFWPGLVILITVLAINMFGDGLRDALDPKLKD